MLGTLTKRSNIYISEEKVEMPEQNTPRGTPTNVCQTPRFETQVFFSPSLGENALESFTQPAQGFLGRYSSGKCLRVICRKNKQ